MTWQELILLLVMLLMPASVFLGEGIKDMFYAIVNRPDRRRLSKKDEKELRAKVEDQQKIIDFAAEMAREVQAADNALPQLPQPTKDLVDDFMNAVRPRPQLPGSKKQPDK